MNDREEVESQADLFAQQKLDALTQIVRSASHDVNNVLAIVISSVELANAIMGASASPRLVKAMNNIKAGVDRGNGMIKFLKAGAYKNIGEPEIIGKKAIEETKDFLEKALRGDMNLESAIPQDIWHICVPRDQLDLTLVNIAFALKDDMMIGNSISFEAWNESGATSNVCFCLEEKIKPTPQKQRTLVHRGPGLEQALVQAQAFVQPLLGKIESTKTKVLIKFPRV